MDKNELTEYLSDAKFNDGYSYDFNKNNVKQKRIQRIVELCINQKVIHVGCVDHIPIIEEKIANKTWLHALINSVTPNNMGIDNNEAGINFIKKLGYTNVVFDDLLQPKSSELITSNWDVMVLGEILEHVDNPLSFLKQINNLYCNNVKKIVISVPNATCYYNIKNAKLGKEIINSDHRSTFTPYTLHKILYIAGFKNIEINFVDPVVSFPQKVINKVLGKLSFSKPQGLSHTLLAEANFN